MVLTQPAMAGPANKQGRLIADKINGREIKNNGYIGSGIIKLFKLNIAATGLSENMLKKTKIDYEIVYAAPPGMVGIMPGAHLVFSKLLFEKKTGKVLGGQFASTGSSDKRADVIATAIKAEMTVNDLFDLELTYAPSFGTGKDVINKLGYIGSNLNEEAFKQISFMKVYDLLKAKEQIIDARESCFYEKGHVKGVVNISWSTMRDRLDEIDKTRPVYVHCRTGEISYNMVLMLQANGYDATNVAGSYEFIKTYEEMSCYNDSTRENIMIGDCDGCCSTVEKKK